MQNQGSLAIQCGIRNAEFGIEGPLQFNSECGMRNSELKVASLRFYPCEDDV